MKNIIYLRVSKEKEGLQDLDQQLHPIIDKFNLKEYTVFKEKGSAYKIEKISKRKEFLKITELMFDSNKTTIKDLFLGRINYQEVNLYVWDYHRIMRNFEYNLLFSLLSDLFNVKIFSYKQGEISKKKQEKPFEKFARYMFFSINAFSSEEYSWNISENVKKAVIRKDLSVRSSDGNKWGRNFTDIKGNKIILSEEQEKKMKLRIYHLIEYYTKRNIKQFYNIVIDTIKLEFGINLSKAYLSKIKKIIDEVR